MAKDIIVSPPRPLTEEKKYREFHSTSEFHHADAGFDLGGQFSGAVKFLGFEIRRPSLPPGLKKYVGSFVTESDDRNAVAGRLEVVNTFQSGIDLGLQGRVFGQVSTTYGRDVVFPSKVEATTIDGQEAMKVTPRAMEGSWGSVIPPADFFGDFDVAQIRGGFSLGAEARARLLGREQELVDPETGRKMVVGEGGLFDLHGWAQAEGGFALSGLRIVGSGKNVDVPAKWGMVLQGVDDPLVGLQWSTAPNTTVEASAKGAEINAAVEAGARMAVAGMWMADGTFEGLFGVDLSLAAHARAWTSKMDVVARGGGLLEIEEMYSRTTQVGLNKDAAVVVPLGRNPNKLPGPIKRLVGSFSRSGVPVRV